MRPLTEDTRYRDDNKNISLINSTEYAAGSNNLFTQPPPPNISGDVI